jgi:hypothetical protein
MDIPVLWIDGAKLDAWHDAGGLDGKTILEAIDDQERCEMLDQIGDMQAAILMRQED